MEFSTFMMAHFDLEEGQHQAAPRFMAELTALLTDLIVIHLGVTHASQHLILVEKTTDYHEKESCC